MEAECSKPIKNIVLAEDDSDDLDVFKNALSESNPSIHLQTVSNGQDLLSLLNNYCPDLLFLDLDMPFKNGLECLIEIRSTPSLQYLPVVIFSSTSRQANIQTAYEMGAHLFLVKSPFYRQYIDAIKSTLTYDWSDPDSIKTKFLIDGKYQAFS